MSFHSWQDFDSYGVSSPWEWRLRVASAFPLWHSSTYHGLDRRGENPGHLVYDTEGNVNKGKCKGPGVRQDLREGVLRNT
jgi:hypothetical protein